MMVNLQTVFSAVWDDPRFYNAAAYALCGVLLLIWSIATLRSRPNPQKMWLALGAIAALTMLPFYHRQQDARLLLLTVPACTLLWAEGNWIGRLALLVNTAGFVLVGDIPWIIFFNLIHRLPRPTTKLAERTLVAIQILPVPLILLTICVFYLSVYVRRCYAQTRLEQDHARV